MKLAGIKGGDVVRCDVRGDRFWALALTVNKGSVVIASLIDGRPIPALKVSSRQVIGHWSRRAGSVEL